MPYIYEENNQYASVRLDEQAAFKSSTVWYVRACKGLRPVFQQLNQFLFVTKSSVYDLLSNFLFHIILLYVLISKSCLL